MRLAHWAIAFKTGLFTGVLAVLLTFTPAAKWYANRYTNALVAGCLTIVGDACSHARQTGGMNVAASEFASVDGRRAMLPVRASNAAVSGLAGDLEWA